jgi:hypothetical protein
MRKLRFWPTALLAMAITSGPVLLSGCYGQVRYYDTDYGVYHTWNRHEGVYYQQWENDTHRRHENFRDRNKQDQEEYWRWRHDHQ